VSEMTIAAWALYRILWKGTTEEVFRGFLRTVSDCADVTFCISVPQPESSDRKRWVR